MNNNKHLPLLPSSNNYSTVQQVAMDSNYGTPVRKNTTSTSDGSILRTTGKKFGVRAGIATKRCKSVTRMTTFRSKLHAKWCFIIIR
jgi:hypothetical protein